MVAKRTLRRNLSRLAGGVFGLLLVLGFVWFVRGMMVGKTAKPWRQVQIVQVIRPPPPPDQPPPPPPEQAAVPLPDDRPRPGPGTPPPPAGHSCGLDADVRA